MNSNKIIGLLLLFLLIFSIGCADLAPEAVIDGDTARIDVKLSGLDSYDSATFSISQDVYETAKKHGSVDKIVVGVFMGKEGVSDKYGNDLEDDLVMGEIVVTDLVEVRKYTDSGNYAIQNGPYYQIKLAGLDHAYLLR